MQCVGGAKCTNKQSDPSVSEFNPPSLVDLFNSVGASVQVSYLLQVTEFNQTESKISQIAQEEPVYRWSICSFVPEFNPPTLNTKALANQ